MTRRYAVSVYSALSRVAMRSAWCVSIAARSSEEPLWMRDARFQSACGERGLQELAFRTGLTAFTIQEKYVFM